MQVRRSFWITVGGTVGLLLLGLLFTRFIQPQPAANQTREADRINLALRRTAHHLLRAAGDSTSRIPAVQQTNAHTFRLPLSRAFDYDTMPGLLRASLQLHQITTPYDVAVLDCGTQTLQLGYSVRDLTDEQPVPCGGRLMAAGCYVLQVTFTTPPALPLTWPVWPVLAALGVMTGWLLIRQRRPGQSEAADGAMTSEAGSMQPPTDQVRVGRFCFDYTKQTLTSESARHTLTYREAKLLRLLASHPNEVLAREQIQRQVWEDEGIIVGRSLDVFISRLRKLLSDDPAVRIATIHGVGYRLEAPVEAHL